MMHSLLVYTEDNKIADFIKEFGFSPVSNPKVI